MGLRLRKGLSEEAARREEFVGGVFERKETERSRQVFEDADWRVRT